MGLFGKSDKEKEREAQQAHEEARRRMEEAKRKAAQREAADRGRAAAPQPTPAPGSAGARPAAATAPAGRTVPAAQAPAPTGATDGGTYTVVSGDSLSKIAKKHLGDAKRWRELYDANKGVIGDDPDLIKPGQKLRIPGTSGKPLA